jgi:hypothetical protein
MFQLNTKVGEYEITLILIKEEHHPIFVKSYEFCAQKKRGCPVCKFCCNVWNFLFTCSSCLFLYQQACEYVANTSSKFQMVGPSRGHPNGFGGASGSNDPPLPPPLNMTPMEAFMVAQAEPICYLMQHQQPPQNPRVNVTSSSCG